MILLLLLFLRISSLPSTYHPSLISPTFLSSFLRFIFSFLFFLPPFYFLLSYALFLFWDDPSFFLSPPPTLFSSKIIFIFGLLSSFAPIILIWPSTENKKRWIIITIKTKEGVIKIPRKGVVGCLIESSMNGYVTLPATYRSVIFCDWDLCWIVLCCSESFYRVCWWLSRFSFYRTKDFLRPKSSFLSLHDWIELYFEINYFICNGHELRCDDRYQRNYHDEHLKWNLSIFNISTVTMLFSHSIPNISRMFITAITIIIIITLIYFNIALLINIFNSTRHLLPTKMMTGIATNRICLVSQVAERFRGILWLYLIALSQKCPPSIYLSPILSASLARTVLSSSVSVYPSSSISLFLCYTLPLFASLSASAYSVSLFLNISLLVISLNDFPVIFFVFSLLSLTLSHSFCLFSLSFFLYHSLFFSLPTHPFFLSLPYTS